MSPDKIKEVTDLILRRLNEKRVGFLWREEPPRFARIDGFSWIHYTLHASWHEPADKIYYLGGLGDPAREGRTLDMLVVPSAAAGLMLEVAYGVTVSPGSALVDGALRASVPVLLDVSLLEDWLVSAAMPEAKAARVLMETLVSRGADFIGPCRPEEPLPARQEEESVATLRGGWLSWGEVSEAVAGQRAVRLSPGTRLTPEAADRLARLDIRVEEVC